MSGAQVFCKMWYFACWQHLSYVKRRVESQLKALGHVQKKAGALISLWGERKPQQNPADLRNRGSLGKDSPGQLISCANPCLPLRLNTSGSSQKLCLNLRNTKKILGLKVWGLILLMEKHILKSKIVVPGYMWEH